MIRYGIRHETRYRYGDAVDLGFHLLRLTPLNTGRQRLLQHSLTIAPEAPAPRAFIDHFGNIVHYVAIERLHDEFLAVLDAEIEVAGAERGTAGEAWEEVRDAVRGDGFPASPTIAEFVCPSPLAAPDDSATDYAAQSFAAGRPVIEGLTELTARIHRDFAYVPNSTNVATKVEEVVATRRGVCQDFAHLMISGLRGLGLPARYVSGYVRTHLAEGAPPLQGADASHAWVAAWCGPEAGWVEVDPTNDLVVGDQHVVVAYGRDFSDVTPLRGVILGGGRHALSVAVSVNPIGESAACTTGT